MWINKDLFVLLKHLEPTTETARSGSRNVGFDVAALRVWATAILRSFAYSALHSLSQNRHPQNDILAMSLWSLWCRCLDRYQQFMDSDQILKVPFRLRLRHHNFLSQRVATSRNEVTAGDLSDIAPWQRADGPEPRASETSETSETCSALWRHRQRVRQRRQESER